MSPQGNELDEETSRRVFLSGRGPPGPAWSLRPWPVVELDSAEPTCSPILFIELSLLCFPRPVHANAQVVYLFFVLLIETLPVSLFIFFSQPGENPVALHFLAQVDLNLSFRFPRVHTGG